eukprot:COSAG01_NODE_493_length_16327_cov_5.632879_5_plen_205_part_00
MDRRQRARCSTYRSLPPPPPYIYHSDAAARLRPGAAAPACSPLDRHCTAPCVLRRALSACTHHTGRRPRPGAAAPARRPPDRHYTAPSTTGADEHDDGAHHCRPQPQRPRRGRRWQHSTPTAWVTRDAPTRPARGYLDLQPPWTGLATQGRRHAPCPPRTRTGSQVSDHPPVTVLPRGQTAQAGVLLDLTTQPLQISHPWAVLV